MEHNHIGIMLTEADVVSILKKKMCLSSPDIPENEAQYWTDKLEQINSMEIHDEV